MSRSGGSRLCWGMALATLAVVAGWWGCGPSKPPVMAEALVVTRAPESPLAPLQATTNRSVGVGDYGDAFYPSNSQVVLLNPNWPPEEIDLLARKSLPPLRRDAAAKDSTNAIRPGVVRNISRGLHRAGGAVVSPDGKRVYFAAKATPESTWQIYEADIRHGNWRPLTAMPGGAMAPAVLPGGALVFCSPVPKLGEVWTTTEPAALYVLKPGGKPRRITFGPKSALDPTVLQDGRILFVTAHTREDPAAPLSLGLYTVNSDGTELTRFALDGDGPPLVARPRELPGKRIGFLAQEEGRMVVQYVSTARPFLSRSHLALRGLLGTQNFTAIEPLDGTGDIICVGLKKPPPMAPVIFVPLGILAGPVTNETKVSYLWSRWVNLTAPSSAAETVPSDEYFYHDLEAVAIRPRPAPTGHMSAVMESKKTGIILCMDANYHRAGATKATAVRVTARVNGVDKVLGEVPLQSDGSFIAEVPADTLLGFETLEGGRVVHRQPPSLWVRPGENRSCIGCHEPYNRSPRNLRPQAANLVPPVLSQVKDLPENVRQTKP